MNAANCILSGIDLGPDTEKNLAYTAYFASRTGAKVSLLYIIDYLLTPPSYLASYIEEEKKKEEEEMARLQDLLGGIDVKTESRVMLGRLHESFMKFIQETSADLLVIGYKAHLLRPSSSERLIKSLAMPMLVVRGERAEKASPGEVKIRKILCPVDFSENARKAISMAKAYAGLFSAELHILHVVPSHLMKTKWEQWINPDESNSQKFEEGLLSDASAKLSKLMKECNIPAEAEIVQGAPGPMICSVAEEGAYDMIVMGARGLSYLEGVLIGSTTETVLKTSPCPVLIVH
jgi:nucleotide-binding universal stress UspA family protein